MISHMFDSGGSRTLRAVLRQDQEERKRLETCKEAVARFLRETVSEHIGDGMRTRGVGEKEAKHSQSPRYVRRHSESANGNLFRQALLAMKLYQIEIHSCFVERQAF